MSGNTTAINLIGMALKGGNAAVGRNPVRDTIHGGRAARLFLASDAGNAVVTEMRVLAEEHGVPVSELSGKKALGRALGRAEVAVVAITDPGLADAILEAMTRNDDAAESQALSENAVRRQV